jgi:murein DD-endopeptidase MepM/ murein hydrolase activator NlpD
VRVPYRVSLLLLLALVLASPAFGGGGGDIYRQKRQIDERLSSLHSKLAHAKAQEGVLTQEITVVSGKIHGLQNDVAGAQRRLNVLDRQLAVHQQRLDRVQGLLDAETRKLVVLRHSYSIALTRLNRRVLDAYETPGVDAIDVMLSTTSMSQMLSDIEWLHQIGAQDKFVSDQLHAAKTAMQRVRTRTLHIRATVAAEVAAVRVRRDQVHAVADQLISTQEQLATARASKRATLAAIKVNEREFQGEANALAAQSASLEARIRAAESSSSSTTSSSQSPSSHGFIWPVQGPITSPFGPRCLSNGDCSNHPGIDIAVPSGTPVHAAAAGTVIIAGWVDGYGNFVVIDHGGGLSTGYGHNSRLAVSVGQQVAQGQVVSYSGCTGYCFGPHVHFEVRVNGTPVDPMGYL